MLPPGCGKLSIRRVATGSRLQCKPPSGHSRTLQARAVGIAANHNHVDLSGFHGADNLAQVPHLPTGSARFECKIFIERVPCARAFATESRQAVTSLRAAGPRGVCRSDRPWTDFGRSQGGASDQRTSETDMKSRRSMNYLSKGENRMPTPRRQKSLRWARDKLANGTFGTPPLARKTLCTAQDNVR